MSPLVQQYTLHRQHHRDVERLVKALRAQGLHRRDADAWDNVTALQAIASLRLHETSQRFTSAHWEELYALGGYEG